MSNMSDSITISTLISRLEPLGTSAVQTKNSPGATTGGHTTWLQRWCPCQLMVMVMVMVMVMQEKLTSMPMSAATGSTTSTSSQAASLVPSSSW